MTWPLPTRKAWSPAATWSPMRCAAAACTCCRWTASIRPSFSACRTRPRPNGWRRILLTASGGPFYGMTAAELKGKTKADALKHPNWNMGAKITIDSATLMNKGLELIEAVWLFGLPEDKIQIVVQRESVIHSAVQFADHSVIAQLGVPDMRIPIQYALTWPDRLPGPAPELDFAALTKLTFGTADEETFRCLAACKKAIRKGGLAPCAANGANEEAVRLFLQDKIGFLDIGRLVRALWTATASAATIRWPTSTSATKWRALTSFSSVTLPARPAHAGRALAFLRGEYDSFAHHCGRHPCVRHRRAGTRVGAFPRRPALRRPGGGICHRLRPGRLETHRKGRHAVQHPPAAAGRLQHDGRLHRPRRSGGGRVRPHLGSAGRRKPAPDQKSPGARRSCPTPSTARPTRKPRRDSGFLSLPAAR